MTAKRVAALYDIHGNLPALEAVITEVRREKVDLIMVGGDIVPGPMCSEVLDYLLGLDIATEFIAGNCEREMLALAAGEKPASLPERLYDLVKGVANELGPARQKTLANWPQTRRVAIEGIGEALICHATPRNDTEIFTRQTADDKLLPVFAGANAALVTVGHTHMPFDRKVGDVRVVNAGSVGMPFCEPQGAYWLLVGPEVVFKRTDYDFAQAAERIRQTSYPEAEKFVSTYVLNTPTESQTLAELTPAELKP
jgi:predicted phosphodiesterase